MWRRIFPKRTSDADLEEELQAHLAIETTQLMERGMTREDAEWEARRRFGNSARILEDTRDIRGFASLGRLWQDLRYAVRILRRAPGFTVAAVFSLALGIGATTAVFSIADTIFLRPLPYANSSQLTWVGVHFSNIGVDFLPSPDYVAWRRDNQVFQSLGAMQATLSSSMVLDGPDQAEVHAGRVSANFLDVFAVSPAIGRGFRPEEELPNGPKAVVLMYPFWRDHFHSRREVVGSAISLDGIPYTVAGVLPQSFLYPVDLKIDVLTTLPISPTASHRDRSMSTWAVFGRLKPGVTLPQARADLERLYAVSKADFPQLFKDDKLVLQPLREHRAGNVHTLLFILMSAAGCLLAIACANVANLLLARWSARARELAVRAAIGASRGRLARQLFAEIGLLTLTGTLVGMLFVELALRGFVHFASGEFPRMSEAGVDFRVFGIALLLSAATAVIFGGLPALRAGRADLQLVLQQAGRGSTGGHQLLRRALVSLEVALSVVLLSGATLLLETLWHLQNDHLGFHPDHLITVSVPLKHSEYTGPARQTLADDVAGFLGRIPGTAVVSQTGCTPLTGGTASVTFSRSDRPLPEPFHRGDGVAYCGADGFYMAAAGARLVRGRFYTTPSPTPNFGLSLSYQDEPGKAAVINEAAARAYFPGEDPIGKQILGGRAADFKTVVGVIADSKNQGLNHPASPQALVNDIGPNGAADLLFLVRTQASEEMVARALHEGIRAGNTAHPDVFARVQSMDDTMGQMTAGPRFNTVLVSTFAAVAFLMAVVGVWGVLAFSVTQRRKEIGIRMALGATPRTVLTMVMREGVWLVTAGVFAGVATSLLLTRFLKTLLYGVSATDPTTYAVVAAVLSIAALAASFAPARRAAVLDPTVALRHE